MPVELECDDTQRRCTFRLVGCVSLQEVVAARTQQAADGRWNYASIVDTTRRTRTPTTEDLRALRAAIEALSVQHGPLGPVAMIAPTNVGYGMGRMYEVFAQPSPFAVFREPEDAERWLAAASRRDSSAQSRLTGTTTS
jgi:hypothetical protein